MAGVTKYRKLQYRMLRDSCNGAALALRPLIHIHQNTYLATLHPICQIPRIPQNSLKIVFWIHRWTSKKICSKRYTQYGYILFWTPRKWLYKRSKNCRRSRPPSAADFLCCFGVLNLKYNHFLGVQNEICTYWIYLMEHICLRSKYVLKYRCSMMFPNSRPTQICQSSA